MKPFKQVFATNDTPQHRDQLVKHFKSNFPDAEKYSDKELQDIVDKELERLRQAKVFQNNKYNVIVQDWVELGTNKPSEFIHLSIRRLDQEPIHDWRHFQQIKNMLIGKDHEGVELYPAESRLIDTSNQYHMFVFKDANMRMPFGFPGRCVIEKGGTSEAGTKQRSY